MNIENCNQICPASSSSLLHYAILIQCSVVVGSCVSSRLRDSFCLHSAIRHLSWHSAFYRHRSHLLLHSFSACLHLAQCSDCLFKNCHPSVKWSPLSSRHDWYPHPQSARLLTKWIIKIREWDHRTLQKLGTAAAYLHLQKMDGNQSQHSSKYGTSSNFLPTHWSHGHWISILIKECGSRESLSIKY